MSERIIYEVVGVQNPETQGMHLGGKWIYGDDRFGVRLYELRNDKLHYVHLTSAHFFINPLDPVERFKYSGFTFKLVK